MSIADKLTQLDGIRTSMREKLVAKGVDASTHNFADFPNDVESISTGGLPSEYEAVDYIESTGTQYIDTEIVPTDDVAISITALQTEVGAGQNQFRGPSVYQSGQRCYIPSFWTPNSYDTKWGLCYGGIDSNINFGKTMPVNNVYNAYARYTTSYQTVTVNGASTSLQSVSTSISITNTMYLFANNGTNGAETFLKQRLFSLKVWLNGTLTADFVPCYRKSDNVIGLYDTARSKFYTNAGTGSFTCYHAPPSN